MRELRTIILAAGKGTRMKSVVPKVLHKVCGQPILQYVLDISRQVGSLKNYIVVGYQAKEVKNFLPKEAIAVEQSELLGTADAVRRVEKYLKSFSGDVLILCGDTPLLNLEVIKNLIHQHRQSQSACTFLTAVVEDPSGYGRVIRDANKKASAIREDKDASLAELKIAEINVGVYCFNSRKLFETLRLIQQNAKKKEFYLTDIIHLFFEKGEPVETIKTNDAREGLGVNTREDLAMAQKTLRRRILKKLMLDGVTISDPHTTFIDASVKIGQDTTIEPFTVIEKDVVIGSFCRIGPFAHLRPGTRLGNNVEIGNFTEVSRTQIKDHTLMKHFSFLGDANIGSGVNIGAGTITANFDGKNKNKTTILDGAFIGSDTILIAPVKIGKKAITAAGSVVTKGQVVPDGKLAIGVPAKVMSKGKTK